MMKWMKKHRVLIVVSLIFVILGTTLCIEYVPIYQGEFSSERWERHPALRYKMIEDMEEELDIWTLNKEEIISVLGKRDTYGTSANLLVYLIERPMLFFPEYYAIKFNDDNTVIEIYRYRD